MDLRWRHVETALIELLLVMEEDRGAFRARIRHLKAVGIPTIPKVGSGTQINYTRDHVIQLYMALLIMELGVTPKGAAKLVGAVEAYPHEKPNYDAADNDFLVIIPDASGSHSATMVKGEENMVSFIKTVPHRVFGTLRITDCLRAVDWALKEKEAE